MRRKRRSPGEPGGHDRWLVSYSDFITLLFAFFVVLFASTYRDSHSIPAVSNAIHAGFQKMGAFSSEDPRDAGSPQRLQAGLNAPEPSARMKALQEASAATAVDILELQRQLEEAIGQELRNHEVIMRVTPEGFVISLNELGFFDSGKATLLPGAAEKIGRIAKVLSQHGLNLRIEGHSDDQPIHNGQFRSNWELSTARAMAVLSLLLTDSSFNPAHLSVAGYGEYRPVTSNATAEGRRMNRRVDLVVVATVGQP